MISDLDPNAAFVIVSFVTFVTFVTIVVAIFGTATIYLVKETIDRRVRRVRR